MRLQQHTFWALGLAICGLFAIQSQADEANNANNRDGRVDAPHTYQVQKIVGMTVKNKEGKTIGAIEDLVVNLPDGMVRYAALRSGDTLGFGGKLFAVPWESFVFKYGETERYLVADITHAQLKGADGFDSSNWPDMANATWGDDVRKSFDVKSKDKAKQTNHASEKRRANVTQDMVMRTATILDIPIQNRQGKDLGAFRDLVIDLDSGQTKYAAFAFGGTFGFGEKLFAMPWKQFHLKRTSDDRYFVLNIDPKTLEDAPGFNADNWPNTANDKWGQEIDNYYHGRKTTREKDLQ